MATGFYMKLCSPNRSLFFLICLLCVANSAFGSEMTPFKSSVSLDSNLAKSAQEAIGNSSYLKKKKEEKKAKVYAPPNPDRPELFKNPRNKKNKKFKLIK